MDDAKTRSHVQDHADAVVRGDMDAVAADMVEDLRPALAQIAPLLPQPVTSAEVESLEVGDEECVAMIAYSGNDKTLKIRSRWRDVDGRPMIVHAEPQV